MVGVADWFQSFCDAIQIKNQSTISQRYRAITRRLNSDFWNTTSETAHSLYVGSYGRNTAIDGFSDLDMIMQLPYAVYDQYDRHSGNGQSALLQAVRTSMAKTYSSSSIGADGQVVSVSFVDGLTFEVVPAFINENDSYTFPNANSGGSWKTTNPKPEIAAVRARNDVCNGNLIPLCRMMRSWKHKWEVPIGGLLIDTLAYQFIEGYEHRKRSYLYYDFMCRDFFRWMADQSSTQDFWKAPGSGQYVYGKGLFQYKATRCYNIAVQAIRNEQAKPSQEWAAKQRWREIFGTSFPS